jgi:hypothetical protein
VAQVIVFVNKIGSYVHNATQANYGAPAMRAVLLRTNGVFFSARPSRRARALLYTPSAVAPLATAAPNAPRMRLERSLPAQVHPTRTSATRFCSSGFRYRRCPAAAHCVPHPAGVSAVPPSNGAVGWLRC